MLVSKQKLGTCKPEIVKCKFFSPPPNILKIAMYLTKYGRKKRFCLVLLQRTCKGKTNMSNEPFPIFKSEFRNLQGVQRGRANQESPNRF